MTMTVYKSRDYSEHVTTCWIILMHFFVSIRAKSKWTEWRIFFYTFLPAIPNNPKSLAFWLANTLREEIRCVFIKRTPRQGLKKRRETFCPEGSLLSEPSTDLMTHCSEVICWSYCQGGSKYSTTDRTSSSLPWNQCATGRGSLCSAKKN